MEVWQASLLQCGNEQPRSTLNIENSMASLQGEESTFPFHSYVLYTSVHKQWLLLLFTMETGDALLFPMGIFPK